MDSEETFQLAALMTAEEFNDAITAAKENIISLNTKRNDCLNSLKMARTSQQTAARTRVLRKVEQDILEATEKLDSLQQGLEGLQEMERLRLQQEAEEAAAPANRTLDEKDEDYVPSDIEASCITLSPRIGHADVEAADYIAHEDLDGPDPAFKPLESGESVVDNEETPDEGLGEGEDADAEGESEQEEETPSAEDNAGTNVGGKGSTSAGTDSLVGSRAPTSDGGPVDAPLKEDPAEMTVLPSGSSVDTLKAIVKGEGPRSKKGRAPPRPREEIQEEVMERFERFEGWVDIALSNTLKGVVVPTAFRNGVRIYQLLQYRFATVARIVGLQLFILGGDNKSRHRTKCHYHTLFDHQSDKNDEDFGRITGVYTRRIEGVAAPEDLRRRMPVQKSIKVSLVPGATLYPKTGPVLANDLTLDDLYQFYPRHPDTGAHLLHCGCLLEDVLLDFYIWKAYPFLSSPTIEDEPYGAPMDPRQRTWVCQILRSLGVKLDELYEFDILGRPQESPFGVLHKIQKLWNSIAGTVERPLVLPSNQPGRKAKKVQKELVKLVLSIEYGAEDDDEEGRAWRKVQESLTAFCDVSGKHEGAGTSKSKERSGKKKDRGDDDSKDEEERERQERKRERKRRKEREREEEEKEKQRKRERKERKREKEKERDREGKKRSRKRSRSPSVASSEAGPSRRDSKKKRAQSDSD